MKKLLLSIVNVIISVFFIFAVLLGFEQLFINEQTSFGEKYSEYTIHYEKETYIKIFSKLLAFDLSYKNFISYHNDKIDADEQPLYKLTIAKSLISAVFSKKKKKLYIENFFRAI